MEFHNHWIRADPISVEDAVTWDTGEMPKLLIVAGIVMILVGPARFVGERFGPGRHAPATWWSNDAISASIFLLWFFDR
jgi:hypothetical protein